ncbi:MAG: DnaD domain protein [Firmicutes bacterium]|nr:DnaD domain protein [Bacillota bacterium]
MFVRPSPKLTDEQKIQIDNKFILHYMPAAPSDFVKVYLLGLSLISTNSELMSKDNSLERISKMLGLQETDVVGAFEYWAGHGIVKLDNSVYPPIVDYLPTIDTKYSVLKKYATKKYADFNSQLQKMLPTRNFLPRELDEYYQLMESTGLQPLAMPIIVSYCVQLKGESISSAYILTVARNLAKEGFLSPEAVESNLNELELFKNDILDIHKHLKIKSKPDLKDKDLYRKWTTAFKYKKDTLEFVAKKIKKGGMEMLDARLCKYHQMGLFSITQIDDYDARYENMLALAKEVAKTLGLYYERYDGLVENHIAEWMGLGFDNASVLQIANFCHKQNRRSIDQLHSTLLDFYKKGRVSAESLNDFAVKTKQADEFIKNLLTLVGESRLVVSRDRDRYNTWVNSWLLQPEVIEYGATLAKSASNPMAFLNSILADWHQKGIQTVEKAKKETPNKISTSNRPQSFAKTNPAAIQNTVPTQRLTDDEIQAVLDNLTYDDI